MQKVFLNKTSFHEMTRDYNFIWSRVRIVEVCGSNKKFFSENWRRAKTHFLKKTKLGQRQCDQM